MQPRGSLVPFDEGSRGTFLSVENATGKREDEEQGCWVWGANRVARGRQEFGLRAARGNHVFCSHYLVGCGPSATGFLSRDSTHSNSYGTCSSSDNVKNHCVGQRQTCVGWSGEQAASGDPVLWSGF